MQSNFDQILITTMPDKFKTHTVELKGFGIVDLSWLYFQCWK
jgi:hypothetical protein